MDDLRDIEKPKAENTLINPNILIYGPFIDPQKIISLYSADEYQQFTEEWAYDVLPEKYLKVRRVGGPDDMGRDVIAYIDDKGAWDNYQCKHYENPLAPSDIWVEIGKLMYHCWKGTITLPKEYFFVAPKGVGRKLNDLLSNPEDLKRDTLANWEKYCVKKITTTSDVELTDGLKEFIQIADFSIFKSLSPLEVIEQFRSSKRFATRFGGGLGNRPKHEMVGSLDEDQEQLFIKKLFEAYSDHSGREIKTVSDLKDAIEYYEHLKKQREHFYSAEALKMFARDSLPEDSGVFPDFQDEIYDGIIDELRASIADGYENVINATRTASLLPLHGSALRDYISTSDKKGACHQLANEGRVQWVKKKHDQ